MIRSHSRGLLVVLGACLAAMLLAAPVQAQQGADVPPGEDGKVILTWDKFVQITGYDAEKGDSQVLTIPWSEVEALLDVKIPNVSERTQVDLPWNEFKALLQWSIERQQDDTVPPPTDVVIRSAELSGVLSVDGADMKLSLSLNVLREQGWTRIAVLPAGVAVTGAELPEGVFLNVRRERGNVYELMTRKSGPIECEISFQAAVGKSQGINELTIPSVLETSLVLDLAIDRSDVDVKVAGAQSLVVKHTDEQTHFTGAIAVNNPLRVSWERALPEIEPAPAKLYADTRTLVAVAEGVLLCEETVNFNILHTAVRELKLSVPDGVSVLTVSGSGVQDWRVNDSRELVVSLRGEKIGAYSLRVSYEQAGEGTDVPVLRTVGVEREKGYVAVVALANVEIAPGQVTGATGIDVRQLPSDLVSMTNQPVLLGFRYVTDDFTIPLTVRRHEELGVLVTIVDSAAFTSMQLKDGRRITKATYSVRNNRNQFLRVNMPAGAEIWSVMVAGNNVTPAKDEQGNVLLPLVRSGGGSAELAAFPVEIVYVESPAEPAPPAGGMRVDLPSLDVPAMHVMVNCYLPPEGDYTESAGMFGRQPSFTGPLTVVSEFARLAAEAAHAPRPGADVDAQQMAQQFRSRVEGGIAASGGTPIRVRMPVNGTLVKLEKILVLPQDKLFFAYSYRGW